jgi:hypothetical protein
MFRLRSAATYFLLLLCVQATTHLNGSYFLGDILAYKKVIASIFVLFSAVTIYNVIASKKYRYTRVYYRNKPKKIYNDKHMMLMDGLLGAYKTPIAVIVLVTAILTGKNVCTYFRP